MGKKVIAFFGFMSVSTFIWHSILTVKYFLGLMPYHPVLNIGGIMLAVFLTIHMIFALINMVKNAKRTRNERFYMKFIPEHGLQNVSGICIFGFAVLHSIFLELHKVFGTQALDIAWWVSDIFLYLTVAVHLWISLPHIVISCGIVTNRKMYDIIKTIVGIISIVIFIVLTYAHTVFTFA